MPGYETTFLVDTVGDALSKGVAATVAAQPADPVEYLAEWLLRYVESDKQQVAHLKAKKQQIDQEKRRVAQALEEDKERQEAEAARKAAVDGLAATAADPLTLWQTAVRLVKTYTTAAGVYVANIADDEEPDWAAPEDPEADVETDDAADTGTAGEAAADAQTAETGEAAADGDQEDPDAAAEGSAVADGASVTVAVDYSSKLLRYVAANSGQEFMTQLELRRPKAADDGEAEGQKPEHIPVTFKILDDRVPLLEVPTVTTEPRVKFLRSSGFPKIGGYCAAAVPAGSGGPASGSYQGVVAVDTLLPDGHGQALTQEEVGFIWDVAQALGKALDAAADRRKTDAARGGAAEILSGLATAIKELRQSAEPAGAVPEVGDEPAAAEGEGDSAADSAASPADRITQIEAELQYTDQKIAAGRATATNAAAALDLEKRVLDQVVQAITSVRGVAIPALKLFPSSPPATFHVLRAVLLLLGREPAAVATWREASQQLHVGTFEELAAYDATQERNTSLWKKVRAAYKAVQKPKDLEKELPQCGLGALLLQWIKQVRLVSRKAAALRDAEKSTASAEETKVKKEQQLQEAKDAKVKAEEAEAAAVAAAAAEEAAAAAAGEGEGGGEEAAEEDQ